MALNPRQQAFVREYLKGHTATEAAIRAGYKKDNARVIASRLLHSVNIKEAIGSPFKAPDSTGEIEKWRAELGKIVYADIDPTMLTFDHKLRAMDMAGRHYGAYQNENASTVQAFQININIDDKDRE